MKICVFGAGAIGGHLAARLGAGGHEVCIVARKAIVDVVRSRGLTLISGAAQIHSSVRAFETAEEAGEQDLVIVTLKATATATLGNGLEPLLSADTPVLFIVNGFPWWYPYGQKTESAALPTLTFLDRGGQLIRSLGHARVLGGIAHSGNAVSEPGRVVNSTPGNNRVWIGEIDGQHTKRVQDVADILNLADVSTTVEADIRSAVWKKLMRMNIANMPICLLTESPLGVMTKNPRLFELARGIASEGLEVAKAYGYGFEWDFDTSYSRMLQESAEHKSSMLQDFESRRALEIDATLIATQLFARKKKIATPHIDTVTALVIQKAVNAGLYTAQ
jgi:2-dehydropantoate 2-reductase